MADAHQKELNEKSLQILWIIWVAMLGTLFIYVLICHLWDAGMRPTASPDLPLDLIRNILYGVSFFILILTRFIRKRILAGRPDDPGSKPFKSPSLSKQPASLDKYVPAMIVSLALSEFIGIIGLVLFFLGDNFQVFYTFIAISALAMFLYRPRREELQTPAIAM